MSLRLKMAVTQVVPYMHATSGETDSEAITLSAVTGNDGPNASWSKWTPSGTLSFVVTNPDVFGQVAEGQTYFVDLHLTNDDEIEEVVLEEDETEDDGA